MTLKKALKSSFKTEEYNQSGYLPVEDVILIHGRKEECPLHGAIITLLRV